MKRRGIMGYLEVKMALARGRQPDLTSAAVTFADMIKMIGVQVTNAKADNAGNTVRIRAEGVTGLLDKEAIASISYNPSGMIDIIVSQHPDGSDAAEEAAKSLAERITQYNITLGKVAKSKHKRNSSHEMIWAASGWHGMFRAVFIDYKPNG
jgi:hypothetical protein